MKREEKNGGPMQGRLHIKTTQIPPFNHFNHIIFAYILGNRKNDLEQTF